MTHEARESNLRSVARLGTCGRIHAQETGCQSGVRSSIVPGLPTHLLQKLNASAVFKVKTWQNMRQIILSW